MIQFHRYSAIDADRQAAIDARMYLWNRLTEDEVLKRLPDQLPKNWFYQQEIVSCLGRSTAWKKYGVQEEHYHLCRGLKSQNIDMPFPASLTHLQDPVYYQPRNSGLFSVIENIIVADYHAQRNGKRLVIVGDGDWWNYSEEFSAIFPYEVKYAQRPTLSFEKIRDEIFYADMETLTQFYCFKQDSYKKIYKTVSKFMGNNSYYTSMLFFFRGGDKLLTETILPPDDIILSDLKAAARRSETRFLISDDADLAKKIVSMDKDLVNLTLDSQKGYHHVPGKKISCLPILKNYLAMSTANELIACPSANLVNAAFWSRNDQFFSPTTNPVYRYALI